MIELLQATVINYYIMLIHSTYKEQRPLVKQLYRFFDLRSKVLLYFKYVSLILHECEMPIAMSSNCGRIHKIPIGKWSTYKNTVLSNFAKDDN